MPFPYQYFMESFEIIFEICMKFARWCGVGLLGSENNDFLVKFISFFP
jgi:hypothetical protein